MSAQENALHRLEERCRQVDFQGWDLFDGLNSKVLRATPLHRSRLVRLAWIQLFKRSPINLRRLMAVPKGSNAKGLALFASGYLAQGDLPAAKSLLDRLESLRCSGYEGCCWGYNFDWQSRSFFVPEGTPNMVTTAFVANAFLDYFSVSGDERYLAVADGACEFMLEHLIIDEDENVMSFRYIPGEDTVVHNAYMLGAAVLARVYGHTSNARYLESSTKAMRRAVRALRPDGAWPYGENPFHGFVDNFHTGFNLVSLNQWISSTGDRQWESDIRLAYSYWLDNFLLADGCPKYYDDGLYPIDIHCSAQGIVTCLKLESLDGRSREMAGRIADWAIANMQGRRGEFYYQKTRLFTNRISYIRWSQAWMFFALSLLSSQVQNQSSSS